MTMTDFTFEDATKEQAKARVALIGPSGSGKTWTALTIARGLDARTPGVIDTEHGSASKYADRFAFKRLRMNTYDPRDLIKALAAAASAGIDVITVDSLSHFWEGSEGMLEQVDKAGRRSYGGNNFGGWKEMRPVEREMLEALLAYPGHVIVTMRVKTEYVVDEDSRGRKVPRKIGLKPVQRDGLEYEFDLVADLDLENTLTVSKSRCSDLSAAVLRKPDEALGEQLAAWLSDGKPAPTSADYLTHATDDQASYAELLALYREVEARGMLSAAVTDPDDGRPSSLGELVKRRGMAAKGRELARPAPAPEPEQAPATPPEPEPAPEPSQEEPKSGDSTEAPTDTSADMPTDAQEIADVLPDAGTADEVRVLWTRANGAGLLDADVLDSTGQDAKLGELITVRGVELTRAAQNGEHAA